jgi:hypothetical protein
MLDDGKSVTEVAAFLRVSRPTLYRALDAPAEVQCVTLSPSHTRWIALIRYQANTAVEQSRQPVPLSMLAINGLHDAVEALLGLVAEHRELTVKGKDFDKLFDAVRDDVPAVAHHRTAMIALNSTGGLQAPRQRARHDVSRAAPRQRAELPHRPVP